MRETHRTTVTGARQVVWLENRKEPQMKVRQRTGTGGQVKSPQGSAVTPSVEIKQLGRDKNADILGQAAASPAEALVIQSEQNLCL